MLWGVNLQGHGADGGGIFATDRYNCSFTSFVHNIDGLPADWDMIGYFTGKGMRLFRMPIIWERIQGDSEGRDGNYVVYPPSGGPLVADQVDMIWSILNEAQSHGAQVLFDLHNYGHYPNKQWINGTTGEILSGPPVVISAADLAQIWQKIVTEFGSSPAIWGWGLMNEPQAMTYGSTPGPQHWANCAQAAINAIRAIDSTTPILVGGYGWSSAYEWQSSNQNDPLGLLTGSNIIYETHRYLGCTLDGKGGSGPGCTIPSPVPANYDPLTWGQVQYAPFFNWMRNPGKNLYGRKGIVGEVGMCPEAFWRPMQEAALQNFVNNDDILLAVTFWSAGPWAGLWDLDPDNGVDVPQMALIEEFISGTTPSKTLSATVSVRRIQSTNVS